MTEVVPSSRSKNDVLNIRKPESLHCQRIQSGAGVLRVERKLQIIIIRYVGVVWRDAVVGIVGACCPYPRGGKDSGDSLVKGVQKYSEGRAGPPTGAGGII